MIRIHNKSTYQKTYSKLSTIFIDSYVNFRLNGHSTQESLTGAKMEVQSFVSIRIIKDTRNSKELMNAYETLKSDSDLIQKAIKYYQSMK